MSPGQFACDESASERYDFLLVEAIYPMALIPHGPHVV
jgi:hypothetical protein